MIRVVFLIIIPLVCACGGSNSQKPPQEVIIEVKEEEGEEEKVDSVKVLEDLIPFGAVTANFITKEIPFYAFVDHVDYKKGVTFINFERDSLPHLTIEDTYGGSLSSLRFQEFDSDLLLFNAKIKDTSFNIYYLYKFKEGNWLPVVNRFAIHKSHINDSLIPIQVDPKNPNKMFRYYSVFDLDKESKLGYTWRLLNESIPIVNK